MPHCWLSSEIRQGDARIGIDVTLPLKRSPSVRPCSIMKSPPVRSHAAWLSSSPLWRSGSRRAEVNARASASASAIGVAVSPTAACASTPLRPSPLVAGPGSNGSIAAYGTRSTPRSYRAKPRSPDNAK